MTHTGLDTNLPNRRAPTRFLFSTGGLLSFYRKIFVSYEYSLISHFLHASCYIVVVDMLFFALMNYCHRPGRKSPVTLLIPKATWPMSFFPIFFFFIFLTFNTASNRLWL